MINKYILNGKQIKAIQWTGENLREVINIIGLHPSVEAWTWEAYEELVKKEGLKVITGKTTFGVPIGNFIFKNKNKDIINMEPEDFELYWTKIENEDTVIQEPTEETSEIGLLKMLECAVELSYTIKELKLIIQTLTEAAMSEKDMPRVAERAMVKSALNLRTYGGK